MDRLVLGVIAVIGLHTAFVLYMANVRRVEQNETIARSSAAGRTPVPVIQEPAFETEPDATVTPSTLENSLPATPVAMPAYRVKSRAARVNHVARLEGAVPPHVRGSRRSISIPAFPSPRPPGTEYPAEAFSDRVIVYRIKADRPSPALNAVVRSTSDNDMPKQKRSFVSKLQYVYKKPWGLIRAIGSKLH